LEAVKIEGSEEDDSVEVERVGREKIAEVGVKECPLRVKRGKG